MRVLMRFLMVAGLVLATAVMAFAADAPPERAEVFGMVKAFVVQSWPALLAWAASEVMALMPNTKANGLLHLVYLWAKGKGGGAALMVLVLAAGLIAGCTTLNVSLNTTSGDSNKPAIKTDADARQDVSPTTTATIPLK